MLAIKRKLKQVIEENEFDVFFLVLSSHGGKDMKGEFVYVRPILFLFGGNFHSNF